MPEKVRYATEDVYAEVQEEGGPIRRLVAVAGQPVPVAYADYVEDKHTTTDVDEAHDAVARRATSVRRAAPAPEEPSHEEFRETASGQVGPPADEKPQRSRTSSAKKPKS
jgi:hypothetical protein